MEHHTLDINPLPEDKRPLYINEPYLVDETLSELLPRKREPESQSDNIRIYVPIDINGEAVLRRLHCIIQRYGEANEANESDFRAEVYRLIAQTEIYDQVWYVRKVTPGNRHSEKGIELIRKIVQRLREIPDACAESFPYDVIDELRKEYDIH